MEHADFIVIGGGIAGASVGYELAMHGSVVLLEKEPTAGYHTTGRSAALFTEGYERGPVRALTMSGRSFLESPPAGFTETPLLSPLPVLYVGREDQQDSLDELRLATADLVKLDEVDGPGLRELCPALDTDRITKGLLETTAMEIDVHALHHGFLAGIRQRDGRVMTGAPAAEFALEEDIWTVRTAVGLHVQAPIVVNAAGAWSDAVAVAAGVGPLGLQPFRRTAFVFGPEGHDISGWPMVIDIDEDFYFKPERTQLMGSLAEQTPMEPHDVRAEEIDVALAISRITTATSFQIRHVGRTWAGLRTFAPDRLPVVGFSGIRPGFFWLAGQGGYGIMTSPALARTAAGLICEGSIPDDVRAAGVEESTIAPSRFGSGN